MMNKHNVLVKNAHLACESGSAKFGMVPDGGSRAGVLAKDRTSMMQNHERRKQNRETANSESKETLSKRNDVRKKQYEG